MFRSLICSVALLGATSAIRAGELDNDASKGKAALPTPAAVVSASELDSESPTAAHHRGGWGYGGGYRAGFSVGFGYGGGYYGGYRSVGYYGGYGGYGYGVSYYGGYRPYYGYGYGYSYYSPAYYTPYVSVGFYPSYYYGW